MSILSLLVISLLGSVSYCSEVGPIKPLQGKSPSAKDLVESNES
jgi:hypothetical protein